jgi:xanthine dehydrogenase accessory factor
MQGFSAIARAWILQRREGAIVRAIGAEELGPRPSDDMMLVDAAGRTGGSLLAGAIQPEVVSIARQLLHGGAAEAVVTVAVDTVDATAAGLTCGGSVELLVQRLDTIAAELWDTLGAGHAAALVTLLGAEAQTMVVRPGGRLVGTLGTSGLDTLAQSEAEALLAHPGSGRHRVKIGPVEILIEAWNPVPRLLIVGVSDLSGALTRQVELLGWSATTASGLDASLAVVESLSSADVVVVIDHDPFVATPVIAAALRLGVGYVGALGSRRTQRDRRLHLADVGVTQVQIDRLRGPAGLDIGSHTPAETAVSIVAEVIAERTARSGGPLTGTTGRITG